jgi:hypothetical protein
MNEQHHRNLLGQHQHALAREKREKKEMQSDLILQRTRIDEALKLMTEAQAILTSVLEYRERNRKERT